MPITNCSAVINLGYFQILMIKYLDLFINSSEPLDPSLRSLVIVSKLNRTR